LPLKEELKLAILRHGILVLLAQKLLIHEDVEARRQDPWTGFSLEPVDGFGDRLAAEDQLRFLLPLHLMAPDGERDGHENRHHPQADQQRRHGVAAMTVLTL
jgi:hypothetical protein